MAVTLDSILASCRRGKLPPETARQQVRHCQLVRRRVCSPCLHRACNAEVCMRCTAMGTYGSMHPCFACKRMGKAQKKLSSALDMQSVLKGQVKHSGASV